MGVQRWNEKSQPLRNPEPLPVATLNDVKAVLDGLVPAAYKSADLYQRYCEILAGQGREPAHKVVFGRMLKDFGLLRCQRQGAAAWLVQ